MGSGGLRRAAVPDPKPAPGLSERLPNAKEVADQLNVSVRTVRRLIAQKKLATIRIGRAVRILPNSVARLIAGE